MIKILFCSILTVLSIFIVNPVFAGLVAGTIEKIDDKASFYHLRDGKGQEHKIHFDKTTQKTGEIKVGSQVEIDEENGHAKSIKSLEKK